MNLKFNKGFSIIELLVSVTIIALLTGIIVTNLTTSKARSRDAKRVSDIAQLQLALELYFDRCNQYPRLLTGGTTNYLMSLTSGSGPNDNCPPGVTLSTFIGKLPTPVVSGDYRYAVNNYVSNSDTYIPTDYVLQAKLEYSNQATKDDVDGTMSSTYTYVSNSAGNTATSLNCGTASNDLYYCVQPR